MFPSACLTFVGGGGGGALLNLCCIASNFDNGTKSNVLKFQQVIIEHIDFCCSYLMSKVVSDERCYSFRCVEGITDSER